MVHNKNNKETPCVEDWLNLYGDALYAFAYSKLKQPEAAEDVVQETFLSAYKAYDSFKGEASVKTWLFSILRNKIIDLYRKQKRQVPVDDEADVNTMPFNKAGIWNVFVPNWARDPEHILGDKDFAATLKECVDKLQERSKDALLMNVQGDINSEEICKTLEVSPSNLWVILHRARLQVRDCIEKNWYNK